MKVLAILLVALGATASFAAPKVADSGKYTVVTTVSQGKEGFTRRQDMTWQGNNFRSERVLGKSRRVLVRNGSSFYIYEPGRKQATKMTVPASHNVTPVTQMLTESQSIAKKGKKVGREKVAGFDCDVYQLTASQGPHPMNLRAWINRDKRFPAVIKRVVKMSGATETIELKSVKLGIKPAASLFTIPKGTKIVSNKLPQMQNPHAGMQMRSPHAVVKPVPKKATSKR